MNSTALLLLLWHERPQFNSYRRGPVTMAQVKIPPISRINSVELSFFEALQMSPSSLRDLEQSSDSDLSEPTSETENIISKLQQEREQHMAQVAHSFNVNTPSGFVLETDTEALKEFESEQKTSDGAVSEQWINRYFTRANESDISVFITNGSCNDPANPLILIVVAREYDPNDSKRLSKVRAIISTMEKDEKVLLLASSLKSSKGAAGSPKSRLSDKKILQALQPNVSEKKFHKLKSVNSELMQGLLAMIRLRAEFLHVDQKYKAGVVYFNGQQNDQQLLEDQRRSPEYKEFVHILGQEIPLKDFAGFTGGLDTRSNKDGETFICTRWRSSEYAFHVADLISGGAHNRKVHLGNNAVNVVFVDPNSKLPFDPATIASKFNQIFVVVSMETGSDAASRHLACKKPKTVRPSLSLSGSYRDDTSSTESNSEDISESSDSKSVRSSPGNVFPHRSASSETAIIIPQLSKKNVSNPALTLQTRKSHRMKFVEEKDVFYKVCVIRKDTVPVGSDNKSSSAPDYYVYKHSAEFRDTLLQLIKSCQVASYKAKNFEDRITNNRKSFLQSVQKSAFGSIDFK